MSRICSCGGLAIAAFVFWGATQASAQPRDRSPGGDRRGGSRGDQRGEFDLMAFLKQLDSNGNGMIDPDEAEGRRGVMIKAWAQRVGLDATQPLSIEKLAEAVKSSSNSPSESRDNNAKPAEPSAAAPAAGSKTPTVPGFGAEDKTPKAAGFDVPLANSTSALSEKRYSKEVTDYVDRMLRDYDKNKDNVLDAEEMKNIRFQSDPKESDLNKDGKLDRQELLERIAKRFGASSSSSDDRRRGSGGSSSPPDNSEAAALAKFKEYAKGYIKQRDVDSNGMLERTKGEWEEVSSENKKADSNNDGVITLDELAYKMASYGKSDSGSTKTASSSSSPPSSSASPSYGSSRYDRDSSRNSGSSSKASSGAKKTYRPTPPVERLPKNLPDWFLRSDENEDGQVSMSEYAALWSDSKAAEFASFDLDGDGFVTAKECLKKSEKK